MTEDSPVKINGLTASGLTSTFEARFPPDRAYHTSPADRNDHTVRRLARSMALQTEARLIC